MVQNLYRWNEEDPTRSQIISHSRSKKFEKKKVNEYLAGLFLIVYDLLLLKHRNRTNCNSNTILRHWTEDCTTLLFYN